MSEGFLGNLVSERIVLKVSQFSKAQNRTFGFNRTCSGTRRPYSSHARTSEKWEAKMTVCENNTVVDVDQLIDIPRFNGNFHFRTTISNTEYLVSRSMKLN